MTAFSALVYWATVCKTVRPMLSDCCLSVLLSVCPVCDFGVLWPNGGMDQAETWHGGRLGPSHIVLDGDPAHPAQNGHSPSIFDPCPLSPNGWMD